LVGLPSTEQDYIAKLLTEIDEKTLLTMIVFQLIELNGLIKKLNYISGTERTISMEEINEELIFLGNYIECMTKKGIICPVRGIVKKLDKHLKEEEH
jgi:hypothetical protein